MVSRSKYTKDLLGPIVARSHSVADVLRELGLQPTGGNYRYLNSRMRALELDTSHFTGARWNRGLTKESSSAVRDAASRQAYPDDVVFVKNCGIAIFGPKLAGRLRRKGRPYVCENCGITEWQGLALTLHLDHINGINNDNRLENLRFLCPNCHQQTHTWGNSYKRKHRSSEGEASEAHERGAPYLISVRLQ